MWLPSIVRLQNPPHLSAIGLKEEDNHFANMIGIFQKCHHHRSHYGVLILAGTSIRKQRNFLNAFWYTACTELFTEVAITWHKMAMMSRDAKLYTCASFAKEANKTDIERMMRPYNNVTPVLEIRLFLTRPNGSCLIFSYVRFVVLLIHLRLPSCHRVYREQSVPSCQIHLEWHRKTGIRIMDSNIHHATQSR